jgi:hypothetical protein
MSRIPTDGFLNFCKSVEGQVIFTLAQKAEFTFRVVDDGLEFTPLASKTLHKHTRQYVDGVLDLFEESGRSYITTHYNKYTVNASHMLALIDMYLKSNHAAQHIT